MLDGVGYTVQATMRSVSSELCIKQVSVLSL